MYSPDSITCKERGGTYYEESKAGCYVWCTLRDKLLKERKKK
jgi:hypothetical protein